MESAVAPVSDEKVLFGPSSDGSGGNKPVRQRRVRLRPVYSRQPKRINMKTFRILSIFQGLTAGSTLFWQIIAYATETRHYKPLEIIGIGFWGPLLFFSVASILTWVMTTSTHSRCLIATVLGFQIMSVIVGIIMITFATISINHYGKWDYSNLHWKGLYDPEISGRVFCALILLGSVLATLIALATSVMIFRMKCFCCAETNVQTVDDDVMYEVEDVQPKCELE